MKKLSKDSWIYKLYVTNKIYKESKHSLTYVLKNQQIDITQSIQDKRYIPKDHCDLWFEALSCAINYLDEMLVMLIILFCFIGLVVCVIGMAFDLYKNWTQTLESLKYMGIVTGLCGVGFAGYQLMTLKVIKDNFNRVKEKLCPKIEVE